MVSMDIGLGVSFNMIKSCRMNGNDGPTMHCGVREIMWGLRDETWGVHEGGGWISF